MEEKVKLIENVQTEPDETETGTVSFWLQTKSGHIWCESAHGSKAVKPKRGDKVSLVGRFEQRVASKGQATAFCFDSLQILAEVKAAC